MVGAGYGSAVKGSQASDKSLVLSAAVKRRKL